MTATVNRAPMIPMRNKPMMQYALFLRHQSAEKLTSVLSTVMNTTIPSRRHYSTTAN